MRTLLTGFGPFGTTLNNPSARIVAHFARTGAPGHDLTARVLPVSYQRAEQEMRTLLREGAFDAALLLGVAGREAGFCIEQVARFHGTGHRKDCDGRTPIGAEPAPGTAISYAATLPGEIVLEALIAAGISARLSDDAGRYVCNHTYYAALRTIAVERLATRCLFLHVPPDDETYASPVDRAVLSLAQQIEAVRLVLALLCDQKGARL